MIPEDGYFIADAGYKLFEYILTPFPINFGMPDDESNYNYTHSRTRSIIKKKVGIYKNKFRIFKVPLDWGCPYEMGTLIAATIVLHNWMISL